MFVDEIGRMWFSRRESRLKQRMELAGFSEPPVRIFGSMTLALTTLGIAWSAYLVIVLIGMATYGLYSILVLAFFAALSILVLLIAAYVVARIFFEVRLYQRVGSIERNLSGYLREFSTNLRAGEEFVDAFERAATPELGPLYTDIGRLVIEMRGGGRVADALSEYAQRYNSYLIEETFSVIREAYIGGGGLAKVLDRIAEHLDIIDHLKKEAVASVSNYMIFMTVVAIIIAPVLFALSYNLLDLVQTLLRRVVAGGGGTQALPAFVTRFNVSLPDFVAFSRICTATIAGSAAGIIGTVRTGNLRGAPALIIIYVAISLIVYQISLVMFRAFFTHLFVI